MRSLSPKRQRILEFLRSYLQEHSYPPSVRDIQRGCDISSTSVVDYNLQALEREGYLRRSPDVARGIELLEGGLRFSPGAVTVPLVGTIAAGQPIPVPDSGTWQGITPLETLEIPETLLGRQDLLFAVRVRGLSMVDALIDDGDIVVLEPAQGVANGDMVAVWLKLEQEVTLKYLFEEGERVRLQPANPHMAPLYTPRHNVEVQGKVVAVMRRLR